MNVEGLIEKYPKRRIYKNIRKKKLTFCHLFENRTPYLNLMKLIEFVWEELEVSRTYDVVNIGDIGSCIRKCHHVNHLLICCYNSH